MRDSLVILLLLLLTAVFVIARRQRMKLWQLQESVAQREREKQAVFDFLNRFGERLTRSLDQEKALALVVDFLQEATKADAGAVFLREKDDPKTLRPVVVQGMFPPLHKVSTGGKLLAKRKFIADKVRRDSVTVGEGIVGLVAEQGKTLLIRDAEHDARVPKDASDIVPIRDLILAPLMVREEVLGVLVLVNKREDAPFNDNDESLVTAVGDQAAATLDLVRLYGMLADKQRMEQELRLARTFQEMLLPRTVPQIDKAEVAGFSRPALEVGGDYYDYIEVDKDHLGIVIADVSGKGIPGALVVASVRATLQAEARGDLSPKSVLRRVNERALRDTKQGVFITMTYGILNIHTGTFRFCRAGQEPTICCRDENSIPMLHEPPGIALGLVGGDAFEFSEEEVISLREEGTAVLYTDGVVEAMDNDQQEYGQARLHSVIQAHAAESPARIVDEIVRDIELFSEGREQHDDITIVVLQWKRNAASVRATNEETPQRIATTA